MKYPIAVLLSLSMVGCTHARLERPSIPGIVSTSQYSVALYNGDLAVYNSAIANLPTVPCPAVNPCPSPAELTAEIARNNMLDGTLSSVDYVFLLQYEGSLYVDQSAFHTASDIISLGLGVAGTITNGERAKSIIASAFTAFTGSSISIDKNFFRQHTLEALISSMQANRAQIKMQILAKKQLPISQYSWWAAKSDVTSYFSAGTLYEALVELGQITGASAQQQKQALRTMQLAK
jgi:hypothetical protein